MGFRCYTGAAHDQGCQHGATSQLSLGVLYHSHRSSSSSSLSPSSTVAAATHLRCHHRLMCHRRRAVNTTSRRPRGFRRCGHYHGNERRNQAPPNRSDSRRLLHNCSDAIQRADRPVDTDRATTDIARARLDAVV